MWNIPKGASALELIFTLLTIQCATSLLSSHHRSYSLVHSRYTTKCNGLVSEQSHVVSAALISGENNEDTVNKKIRKTTAASAEKRAQALRATQAAAEIALETNKIFNGDKDAVAEDTVAVKVVAKKSRKAVKPKLPTPRERTGLNFTGRDKVSGDFYEYDVPFIDTPRWYRILVRKNSERKVCDSFLKVSEKESSRWYNIMIDSFYPKIHSVRFKSSSTSKSKGERPKELAPVSTPMVPGVIYIKCVMSPDIAEDLEAIMNVRGLVKDSDGLVLPLDPEEEEQIEFLKEETAAELPPEADLLRIGEYVSIVSGRHDGKYGIIQGASNGKISVLIRTEYKDYQDTFEVSEVRHLANPPEKNYKTLTPKEAVEALMLKEPNSEMLRYLRKEGLLNQILYPDEDRSKAPKGFRDREERRGREGGASVRSIAKVQQGGPSPTFSRAQDAIKQQSGDLSDFFDSLESVGGSERDQLDEDSASLDVVNNKASGNEPQQPKIRSWSPKSSASYGSTNPADSVKIHPPKWGNTNRNADFPTKTSSSFNKGEKQKQDSRYGRTDDGGYKFDNSFSDGGGGLGYEDYRRMTNANTNGPSSFNNKGRGKEASEDIDNFDSFIEQILKEVDSGVEQRLAGPPSNDFNSNDDDDLDLGWLDNLDGEAKQDAEKARQIDDADSEAVLDNLIKELKFSKGNSPPSQSKAPDRNRDNPSNSYDNFRGRAAAPNNAGKNSGAWSKTGSKPSVVVASAPQTDQFESFEDYLNALVSFEKGGHSGEKKWFRAEKESVTAPTSAKQEATVTTEDDSLDSFLNAKAPKSKSPSSEVKVPVTSSPALSSKSNDAPTARDQANLLSVKDLKEQLKAKGLKVTGNKAELVNRLIDQSE